MNLSPELRERLIETFAEEAPDEYTAKRLANIVERVLSESEGEKWEALDKDQTERMRGYRVSSPESGMPPRYIVPDRDFENDVFDMHDWRVLIDKINGIIEYLHTYDEKE